MTSSIYLAEYVYPPSTGAPARIRVFAPDVVPTTGETSIEVHAPDAAYAVPLEDPAHIEVHADDAIYQATTEAGHIEVHARGVRHTPLVPNYNPNFPCVIGPEWMPTIDRFMWIDSETQAVAFQLHADSDDIVESVWAMIGCWIGDQSVSLEIYDITSGELPLPDVSWQTFYPSIDRYVAASPWTPGSWGPHTGWDPAVGATAPKWEALDSVNLFPWTWGNNPPQPVDNDQFVFSFYGNGYDFAVGHGGTIGTMAGRWITRIQSWFMAEQYFAVGDASGVTITPYLWMNGRKFYGDAVTIYGRWRANPNELAYNWWVNPETGLPWTPEDINQFDDAYAGGHPNGLGFKMEPTGTANNVGAILQAQLRVESAATDPRLAFSSLIEPAGGEQGGTPCSQGWMEFVLLNTQTSMPNNVPLTIGNKYLFVFRKDTQGATTSLGFATTSTADALDTLDSSLAYQAAGPPFWTTFIGPQVDPAGGRSGPLGAVRLDGATRRVTDLGAETGIAPGIVLENRTSAYFSKDSQPYATTSPVRGGNDPWPDLGEFFQNSQINSGRTMQQEFTPSVNDDYAWIVAMVGQVSNVAPDDLEIRVRRRSDDVQMGGVATITSDMLAAPRTHWQKVGVRLDVAATLVGGVQYYLDITSAADPTQGWLVQALNSGYEPNPTGPPTGSNATAGWGNGIDKLTFGDPLMDRFGWNAPDEPGSVVAEVTIATIPDAPENFTAVAAGETCNIDYIMLTWTPMTDGDIDCGDFGAYEIQREDVHNGVAKWRTIAFIRDATVGAFDDYESPANTVVSYRMRVYRRDGAPSDWTAEDTAVATMSSCGLMFTSNEAPDLTVWYMDLEEEREYEFPSYEQTFAPHDREYHLVYRELEDRGVIFKPKVRVRAGRMPCGPGCDDPTGLGPDVFLPIRNIARAGLSYVCVKNESGNRWFSYVKTPNGQWRQHGAEREGGWAAYTMNLEITEVTDVPSSPDAMGTGS